MRAWLLVALVVVPLAAPLAHAQLPPSPTAAQVAIRAEASTITLSLDEAGTVRLLVSNTGSPTGTPLDQPRKVTLSVQGVPQGWVASVEPAAFDLAPGASQDVTLSVVVSGSANDAVAHLNVTARMAALGPGSVPVLGGQVDPESTDSAAIVATRQDSALRQVVEQAGPYLWIIVLALVAAVVILVTVVAANRRVAVRLASTQAGLRIVPGGRVPFPVMVKNLTRRDDTVMLRAASLPEGWATFIANPQLELAAGEQQEASVLVIAPRDANEGDHVAVGLVATSAQAPRRPAALRFEVTVDAAPPAKPEGKAGAGSRGKAPKQG